MLLLLVSLTLPGWSYAAEVGELPATMAAPDPKPQTNETQPAEPATTTPPAMPAEEAQCRERLETLGVVFEEHEPLEDDLGCSATHPITVSRLSKDVELTPPAVLTCAMAEASARFVQDHAGPLARTTEDCALAMQVLAGPDPHDPASVDTTVPDYLGGLNTPISGMKVGWCTNWYLEHADAMVAKALREAAETLADLGAEIVPVEMPPIEDFHACGRIIILSEAFAIHRQWLAVQPAMYGEFFRLRTRLGAFISADQYLDALRWRRKLAAEMVAAMQGVDVLLTANQNGPAESFENSKQDYHFFGKPSLTRPANVSGQPALTIRGGMADSGLPVGIQVIGHSFADADVLRVGHQFEKARPELHTWPDL